MAGEASRARVGSDRFAGLVPAESMESWDLLSVKNGVMTAATFDNFDDDGEWGCPPRDAGER